MEIQIQLWRLMVLKDHGWLSDDLTEEYLSLLASQPDLDVLAWLVAQEKLTPELAERYEALIVQRIGEDQATQPWQNLSSWKRVTLSLDQHFEANRQSDASENPRKSELTQAWQQFKRDNEVIAMHHASWSDPSATRFKIVKEHARGGLGIVYLAQDTQIRREVALKHIQPSVAGSRELRSKFLFEAEVTGQLEHPSIVPVYALGTDVNGAPYYAMRFVRGDDLRTVIQEFHANRKAGKIELDGPELRQILRRFLDVCESIHFAHQRGVLHRDLKPGNVMLGKYGETFVVDWGLAKTNAAIADLDNNLSTSVELRLPESLQTVDTKTQLGSFMGTPAYAPPEQLRGRWDLVDARSDVYSLGMILFELLTGQLPFQENSIANLLARIETQGLPAAKSILSQIPKGLSRIASKALQAELNNRYESADALRRDVEAWLDDQPLSCTPESTLDRLARWTRKNRGIAVSGLIASLAITCISLVAVFAYRSIAARENAALLQAQTEMKRANDAEQQAEAAASNAMREKNIAEQRRREARSNAYVASIRLAYSAWQRGDLKTMSKSLAAFSGDSGDDDLRGWEWNYLTHLMYKYLFAFDGHRSKISGLSFTKDGKKLYSTGVENEQFLWRLGDEKLETKLKVASTALGSALSPDNQWIAWADNDLFVHLARFPSGLEHRTMPMDAPPKRSGQGTLGRHIAFSPDSSKLACCTFDSLLRIWNLKDSSPPTLTPIPSGGYSVSFHPNGQEVAVVGFTNIVICSTSDGTPLRTLKKIEDLSLVATYSFDGSEIFQVSKNDLVATDSQTGVERRRYQGHSNLINCVQSSHDGRIVVTGARDNTVRVWDASTAKLLRILRGHQNPIATICISLDGSLIASGGADNFIRVWDAEAGINDEQPLNNETRPPSRITKDVSSDGRYSVDQVGSLTDIWDHWTGTVEMLQLADLVPSRISISQDGTRIAASADVSAAVGNVKDILIKHDQVDLRWKHSKSISYIQISANGNYVATGDIEGHVQLIRRDALGRFETQEISLPPSNFPRIQHLRFDRGSKFLVISSINQSSIVDLATNQIVRTIPLERNQKGDYLAEENRMTIVRARSYAPEDDLCYMLMGDTLETKHILQGHSAAVTDSLFTKNGQRVLTIGLDKMLRVWNTESHEELLSVELPIDFPTDMTATANDDVVVMGLNKEYFCLNAGADQFPTTGDRQAAWLWRKIASEFSPNIVDFEQHILSDESVPIMARKKVLAQAQQMKLAPNQFLGQPTSHVELHPTADGSGKLRISKGFLDGGLHLQLRHAHYRHLEAANAYIHESTFADLDRHHLKSLALENCRIPSKFPNDWKKLQNLHEIRLIRCSNFDSNKPIVFWSFGTIPSLLRLDLSETPTGAALLDSLPNLTNLTELNLRKTGITESAPLKRLGSLQSLRLLDLRENQLRQEDITELRTLLAKTTILFEQ